MQPMGMPSRSLNDATECLRLGDDRALAGDVTQIAHGVIHRLRVLDRLAHADVDHDLVDGRHLHDVGIAELFSQRWDDLLEIALFESRRFGVVATA